MYRAVSGMRCSPGASRRSWCSYKEKTESHGKLTTSDIKVMPTGHNRNANACAKFKERVRRSEAMISYSLLRQTVGTVPSHAASSD